MELASVGLADELRSGRRIDWARVVREEVSRSFYKCVLHAEDGNFDKARECLANGADVDYKVRGETALIVATKRGLVDVINFLLEADADVNVIAGGMCSLQYAAKFGNLEVVQTLLDARYDECAMFRYPYGYVPVILAADADHQDVVEYLLDELPEHCDVRTKSEGTTCLMAAAWQGNFDTLQAIVHHKCRPNVLAKAHNGLTAFDIARLKSHRRCAHLLQRKSEEVLVNGLLDDDRPHSLLPPAVARLVHDYWKDLHADDDVELVQRKAMYQKWADMVALTRAMVEHRADPLEVRDREYRVWTYKRAFVGSEMVDWLVRHRKILRIEAVQIGAEMLDMRLIHHVASSEPFIDGRHFYQFQVDGRRRPSERRASAQPLIKADSQRYDELMQIKANMVRHKEAPLHISDRWYHFKLYRDCFPGSEFVGWLIEHADYDREEALSIGQDMMGVHILHRVSSTAQEFRDGYFLYAFTNKWSDEAAADAEGAASATPKSASASSPAAPLAGRAALRTAKNQTMDRMELVEIAKTMMAHRSHPLALKTRRHQFKTFRKAFIGSAFVTWLVEFKFYSQKQAVDIGVAMLKHNIIRHVTNSMPFRNGDFLYQFEFMDTARTRRLAPLEEGVAEVDDSSDADGGGAGSDASGSDAEGDAGAGGGGWGGAIARRRKPMYRTQSMHYSPTKSSHARRSPLSPAPLLSSGARTPKTSAVTSNGASGHEPESARTGSSLLSLSPRRDSQTSSYVLSSPLANARSTSISLTEAAPSASPPVAGVASDRTERRLSSTASAPPANSSPAPVTALGQLRRSSTPAAAHSHSDGSFPRPAPLQLPPPSLAYGGASSPRSVALHHHGESPAPAVATPMRSGSIRSAARKERYLTEIKKLQSKLAELFGSRYLSDELKVDLVRALSDDPDVSARAVALSYRDKYHRHQLHRLPSSSDDPAGYASSPQPLPSPTTPSSGKSSNRIYRVMLQRLEVLHERVQRYRALVDIIDEMLDSDHKLEVKDRRYIFTLYPQSFIGSEFVRWLIRFRSLTREEAHDCAEEMLENRLFRALPSGLLPRTPRAPAAAGTGSGSGESAAAQFVDGFVFYRFQRHDERRVSPLDAKAAFSPPPPPDSQSVAGSDGRRRRSSSAANGATRTANGTGGAVSVSEEGGRRSDKTEDRSEGAHTATEAQEKPGSAANGALVRSLWQSSTSSASTNGTSTTESAATSAEGSASSVAPSAGSASAAADDRPPPPPLRRARSFSFSAFLSPRRRSGSGAARGHRAESGVTRTPTTGRRRNFSSASATSLDADDASSASRSNGGTKPDLRRRGSASTGVARLAEFIVSPRKYSTADAPPPGGSRTPRATTPADSPFGVGAGGLAESSASTLIRQTDEAHIVSSPEFLARQTFRCSTLSRIADDILFPRVFASSSSSSSAAAAAAAAAAASPVLLSHEETSSRASMSSTSATTGGGSDGGRSGRPSSDLMEEAYRMKIYFPKFFARLRHRYNITPQDVADSLCEDAARDDADAQLSDGSSTLLGGKSMQFFYFSKDRRYLIKTVTADELDFFRTIYRDYFKHMENYPHSLLSRFLGMFKITHPDKRICRFLILNNVFDTPLHIHEKFDLKGSTFNRLVPVDAAASPSGGARRSSSSSPSGSGSGSVSDSSPSGSGSGSDSSPPVSGSGSDPSPSDSASSSNRSCASSSSGSAKDSPPFSFRAPPPSASDATASDGTSERPSAAAPAAQPAGGGNRHVPVLKDLNFTDVLRVGHEQKAAIECMMSLDLAFLERAGIMDYSLLVGVHRGGGDGGEEDDAQTLEDREPLSLPVAGDSRRTAADAAAKHKAAASGDFHWPITRQMLNSRPVQVDDRGEVPDGRGEVPGEVPGEAAVCRTAKTSAFQLFCGGLRSYVDDQDTTLVGEGGDTLEAAGHTEVYFLGIIDILQRYNLKKKLESGFKSVVFASHQISSVGPTVYAQRFRDYVSSKLE